MTYFIPESFREVGQACPRAGRALALPVLVLKLRRFCGHGNATG